MKQAKNAQPTPLEWSIQLQLIPRVTVGSNHLFLAPFLIFFEEAINREFSAGLRSMSVQA
jgi:hypothetical protein